MLCIGKRHLYPGFRRAAEGVESSRLRVGLRTQIPDMVDVTQIISQIEHGDPSAAEHLLPLVYDELRKLAAAKMSWEKPGQTLQATALVHEAYLRLVDVQKVQNWDSRSHFFSAAAEAMRRILVESARRKNRVKHGGKHQRVDLEAVELAAEGQRDDLLALDETLTRFAEVEPQKAELVKLRYFAGFSIDEAADLLRISRTTAKRYWTFARAWLLAELNDADNSKKNLKSGGPL